MNRKGQYAIIEHVILLGAGIAITLGFLAAFQTINEDVEMTSAASETQLVAQFVAANAISLAESGSEGRVTLEIPETVAGNEYAVRLRDDGVEVVTRGAEYTASMYGISGNIDMGGQVVSREEQVTITYVNNRMTLSEEQ